MFLVQPDLPPSNWRPACLHCSLPGAPLTTKAFPASVLPLELLISVLSFLHSLQAIAVCAFVSRQWRKAAAQAVPRVVFLYGNEKEGSQLLRKPCRLSTIEVVTVIDTEELHAQFMMGALFARICAEATGTSSHTRHVASCLTPCQTRPAMSTDNLPITHSPAGHALPADGPQHPPVLLEGAGSRACTQAMGAATP